MATKYTNRILKTPYLNEDNDTTDFLTIPDSLITHTRNMIFKTWQILERQLKQIDLEQDPEMYFALEKQTEFLFNVWLQFEVI